MPNVRGDEALLDAVRQVWASVWNCRAWQERQFWQIAHAAVYPAVVVQQAAAADGAGVLITKDLTGQSSEPTITINAKRGLGLRVVDGQTLPEQILYARGSGRLQVTSRSTDDVALVLAPGGGVVEQRSTPGAVVLDEPLVRALDRAAAKVERLFPASGPLDLEWVVSAGRVLLVQVRPYVEAGAR
ncbi:MAG: hypothetical protein FJ125_14330 [Deltaproteobacteria bacterium]|nr:hypothetical protein [Deltaproteobacteria bacterium]